MTDALPSSNGSNGRDPETGRFTRGWKGGTGNPYARRVADFRRVLLEAVTDDDLFDLARTLVEKGKTGDVMAAREIFDRLMGKAKVTMAVETEPEPTIEEAKSKLRALVQQDPTLMKRLAEIVGVRVLPVEGGMPPNTLPSAE